MQNKLKQGEALFAEGKIEEAEKCFLEILNEDPKNKEVYNNLGVIYFQRQDIEQALEYFTKVLEIDPFHKDAILNYSALLKSTNRLDEIAPILDKAIERFPDDQEISRLLSEVRQMRRSGTKIAVLCLPGLQSFLGDIVDYLKTKYDVRTCYSNNNHEIESAIQWADIVWLEWANELAIHVTKNVPSISEKQVICRVHSYEVLHGYLPRINWSRISKTIFVADHVVKIARDIYPAIFQLTECVVIHNGVNLEKFQFKERKPGFNIAVVGSISHKKNPGMWVEVLSRLVQLNHRYTLKVAGEFQELRYKYYMESIIPKLGLTNNIRFYGQVDDITEWFEKEQINYLLTTSPFESFGYSIAEAMAMGYRPLIHAFPGAEDIWPVGCIFGCTDDLIQMIFDRQSYDSRQYRQYITQKYSLQSQLQKIETIIEGMLNRISGEASSSALRCETPVQPQRHMGIPTALTDYHRPEKNVIVTGIPRSGTSLFSVLLNTFENTICLNEILYDVDSLPRDFAEIRRRLIAGEPIPNRYDSSGNLSTDTQGGAVNVEKRVAKQVDGNVLIGSKVNIPYLNQIQKILNYSYKIIAIVRDPVYAIGSWNSKKASIIPEAHVTDDDMHPRWRGFSFASKDKIERQAQIWNFYAHLIWNLKDRIKIYTYELVTSDPEWVVQDVSKFLGLEPSRGIVELKDQNIDSKYPELERVKEAVRKYCPIKDVLGYGYQDYKEPARLGENSRKAVELSDRAYNPKDYWEYRARARLSPNSADPATTARHKGYLFRIIHEYQPRSLLEFGAGVGRLFTEYAGIKKLAFCDISPSYQEEARRAATILGLRGDFHLCTKVDITPFEDKEFDIVVVVSVLLHQKPEEIESVMSELARIGRRVIAISWFEQGLPVDKITNDTHCYMHDYQGLCQRNGWEMRDIEYAERQIYFTYSKRHHNITQHNRNAPRDVKGVSPQNSDTALPEIIQRKEELQPTPTPSKTRRNGARACTSHGLGEETLHTSITFESVKTYLMFIGYPRSGHSLIGSLLDAHPNIVIAHEMDALRFVAQGCECDMLYQLLLENSLAFTKAGRKWTGYSYAVPNQWHGRCIKLKVIGDKKGGRSVWHLRSNPGLLSKLRDVVGVDVKLIHVIRNPFDNISTIFKKEPDKGLQHAIEFYFEMVATVAELKKAVDGQDLHEIKLESFIADSHGQLTKLCAFLGVDTSEYYLRDCASIVFSSPRKTRETVDWSPDLIELVQDTIVKYSFMTGYSYES